MGVGAGLYVYVVVVQRSRSLSHLLMSSCDLLWHFVDIIVCWSWTVKKIVAFRDDFMCMLENYGQTWLLIRVTVCIKFCWSASRTNGMDMVYVVGTITGQWNQTRDFMLIMWCFYLGTCFPNWEICCWLHRLRFLNKNTQRWLLTALTVSCDMLLLSWQPVSQVPQGAWELQLLWYVEDSRVEGCNMCVVKSPWEALLPAAVTGLSVWLTAAISVLMKSHTSSGHVLGQMTFCWRSEMSLYCSVRLLQWDIPVPCHVVVLQCSSVAVRYSRTLSCHCTAVFVCCSEIFPYLVIVIGLENVLVVTKSVVSTPVHLEVKLRVAQGQSITD